MSAGDLPSHTGWRSLLSVELQAVRFGSFFALTQHPKGFFTEMVLAGAPSQLFSMGEK